MEVAHSLDWGHLRTRFSISAPTLVLLLGLLLLAGPTIASLARQDWSTEQGQQGPIVLALGLWLLWRAWPQARSAGRPGSAALATAAAVVAAFVYVLGRISDQILIESYGLYSLVCIACYALLGWRGMRCASFALAYLIFALPAPYTLLWALTSHLRLWITEAVVAFYQLLGFSVVSNGLDIIVDQYVLAVKEACSGMNSLISLSAIGLLYLHLRRHPPAWYYLLLGAPIIGFAIIGNFVRVVVLVALTHFFGDAVAQSYLHEAAGAVTFLTALSGVIGVDALLVGLLRPVGAQG